MPRQNEHLEKAKANRDFAFSLPREDSTRVGWSLVALFYSALHFVEAFNAKYNHDCQDHKQVQDSIARNPQLQVIFPDYADLLQLSWSFRYRYRHFNEDDHTKARQSLQAVEEHVTHLLSS